MVSWDSERNPQTITSTHQSDQSVPISTPGTFNTLQPSGGNTVRLSGTRTVSEGIRDDVYSWNLSRIGLEVVITPPKDLPKWVPKGSRTGKAGSSLTFKGEVRARGGGGGGGDKDSKVTLTIGLLSSALFGICSNYPPMGGKGKANSPDLKIQRAGTSKQFKEITEELIASGDYDFRITAKGEFAVGDKFTLVVDCYDYGAYGLFSAESQILARIEGAAEPVLDLPADENKNHIADDWEQNNVGPDGGMSALSDDDSVPQGAWPGDGLTLFEEYRGFMVKGNHVRTKPSIKDLFVCSSAPGITDGGVELFGKKTGIKVRRINADEMMDQVVNFQAPKAHIVDEKAVSIQIVTQKAIDDAWGSGGGFEHPGGLTFPGKKLILLMKDTDMETIAHEMGHAVWIDHHGDGDYDLSIKDCTGSTPLCDQKKTARNKLKGFAASLGKRLDDVFIAVMHGENSGSLTCFMRYNSADFIEFSPGRFKPYGPAESNLSIFCNDKSGTKCGDAARGECLKQIRVSDKGN